VLKHLFGIEFDAATWRREPGDATILACGGIFLVPEGLRESHALWMGPQVGRRNAERCKLIVPAGFDVAVEEPVAQAELHRERGRDFVIRLALAERLERPRAELNRLYRLLRDLEADP
jgi:hypothetical protein